MDNPGPSQDQPAKKGGDDGKPAVPWIRDIQVLLAILAAAGTALGAWGTYQSTQNKGRIDDLTAQIQATQQFSAGIHDARDVLTNDQHVKAMVELSRLYALARTPQQKLVLIQVAQGSQQWLGLGAMATLIGTDDQMQPTSDSNRQVLASIGRIVANAQTQIAQSVAADAAAAASKPAAARKPRDAPHKRTTGQPGHLPPPVIIMAAPPPRKTGTATDAGALARSADPPLTQSKDSSVAASAALIAALPKTTKQQGWMFLGDAEGNGGTANKPDAPLIPQSASTTAHAVPAVGNQIVACQDINLREVPPHGRVVTIVSRGTTMQVLQPDSRVTNSFGAISVWSHKPITARWSFVEVEEGSSGKTTGCGG